MKKPKSGDLEPETGTLQVVAFTVHLGAMRSKQSHIKKGWVVQLEEEKNFRGSQRKVHREIGGTGLVLKSFMVKVQEMEE